MPQPGHIKDLEAAAIAVAVALRPDKTEADAVRASGLEQSVVHRLLARVKDKHRGIADNVREVSTRDLLENYTDLAKKALDKIDDAKLDKSSAAQLVTIAAIATDKRQLLSGEPTQIMSIEDRRNLNEIGAALLSEMHRRGIDFDAIANPDGTYEVAVTGDTPREVRDNELAR